MRIELRKMELRCFLISLVLVFTPAYSAQPDAASRLSDQPIRFIVPYAAGGGTDFVARLYAKNLSKRLNQTIVIDNRPGASGAVGVDITAKAPLRIILRQ